MAAHPNQKTRSGQKVQNPIHGWDHLASLAPTVADLHRVDRQILCVGTMPTLVFTDTPDEVRCPSDVQEPNDDMQCVLEHVLPVSPPCTIVTGVVPGVGLTTLAHHIAAADPTGYEAVTVFETLGGVDKSTFKKEKGVGIVPAHITRIVLDNVDNPKDVLDALRGKSTGEFPPVVFLQGPLGGFECSDIGGVPVKTFVFKTPVRFKADIDTDYYDLLYQIGNATRLTDSAAAFFDHVLSDPTRRKKIVVKRFKEVKQVEENPKKPQKFTVSVTTGPAIGICLSKTLLRNFDVVASLDDLPKYLFVPSKYTALEPARATPNFAVCIGTKIRFVRPYTVPTVDPPEKPEDGPPPSEDELDEPDEEERPAKKARIEAPVVISKGTVGTVYDVYRVSPKDPLSVVDTTDKKKPVTYTVVKPASDTVVLVKVPEIPTPVWITNIKAAKSKNTGIIEASLGKKWPFVPAYWYPVNSVRGREFSKVHAALGGCTSRKDLLVALSRVKSWADLSVEGLSARHVEDLMEPPQES